MQKNCKLCDAEFVKDGEPYITKKGKVCRSCSILHKLQCTCPACTTWRDEVPVASGELTLKRALTKNVSRPSA